MRRLWLVAAVVVLGVAGWAAPAFAHAVLESTNPAADAVLAKSPGAATLHFGEDVEVPLGALRVFNSAGKRVDQGNAYHPHGDGHSVAINMPANLGPGGYVVTWRVISADSHPVHGAFSFQIGAGGATAAAANSAEATKLLAAGAGSRTVGVVFGIVRFLAFAAMFVLVGGAAFLSGVWPAGRQERRARRLVWAALIATVVATVLAISIQGPYGGGLPLAQMVKPSVLSAVLHTRFGQVYLARLVLLIVAGIPLLALLLRPGRLPRWWAPAAIVTGAAILVTPGLAGHAGTGSLIALAIPFDLIHVAGAAVWVGGLAMLALAVLAGHDTPPDGSLRTIVTRYAQWALAAVGAIAISGGFAAWRQVGSLSAVTTTTYGRLLLTKTIIFAVLVSVASISRQMTFGDLHLPFNLKIPARSSPSASRLSPGPGAVAETRPRRGGDSGRSGTALRRPKRARRPWKTRLRQAVLIELLLAAAILAVTAALVNAQPARSAVALPYATEVHAGAGVLVDVIVEPTRTGPIEIHLYTLSPGWGSDRCARGRRHHEPAISRHQRPQSPPAKGRSRPFPRLRLRHPPARDLETQHDGADHQHRRVQRRPRHRPHPLKLPRNFSAPPNDYLDTHHIAPAGGDHQPTRRPAGMKLKLLAAAGVAAVTVLALGAPAFAHVTTDPDSAPQGGEITLGFRVPNEETNANVTQVEIDLPTDTPLLGVDVEPLPGWTAKVTQTNLNPPVQTDDGPVTQAVSQIIWTAAAGAGTAPGQFQEFYVLVQQLPDKANQVTFKALQTYSDGTIVRWIDPVVAGQPAPDHPTPMLTLTPATDNAQPPRSYVTDLDARRLVHPNRSEHLRPGQNQLRQHRQNHRHHRHRPRRPRPHRRHRRHHHPAPTPKSTNHRPSLTVTRSGPVSSHRQSPGRPFEPAGISTPDCPCRRHSPPTPNRRRHDHYPPRRSDGPFLRPISAGLPRAVPISTGCW